MKVRFFVHYILAMSDKLRSMIKIRVLALDVGERVMPYHMLMHPSIGGTKHETYIHCYLVNLPVFR